MDEIDKIAFVPGGVGGATSVNTRDVQTSLLKLMEDGEVCLLSRLSVKGLNHAHVHFFLFGLNR